MRDRPHTITGSLHMTRPQLQTSSLLITNSILELNHGILRPTHHPLVLCLSVPYGFVSVPRHTQFVNSRLHSACVSHRHLGILASNTLAFNLRVTTHPNTERQFILEYHSPCLLLPLLLILYKFIPSSIIEVTLHKSCHLSKICLNLSLFAY